MQILHELVMFYRTSVDINNVKPGIKQLGVLCVLYNIMNIIIPLQVMNLYVDKIHSIYN